MVAPLGCMGVFVVCQALIWPCSLVMGRLCSACVLVPFVVWSLLLFLCFALLVLFPLFASALF